MQIQILHYLFFCYPTALAIAETFNITPNLTITHTNITPLAQNWDWPIKDDYWLDIRVSNVYMDLEHVQSVLQRAMRTIEKGQSGQPITGILSIEADRNLQPRNEANFVFGAFEGHEVTTDDAYLAATGLMDWYKSEKQKYVCTFHLNDVGPEGKGTFGYGAMKRVWMPFPPSINGNVSISR
ncbi:hypothetical protein JMJ35_008517 [Cladonia borealis]|uniref:Uncharacterized protein n=1 Tax=Cladonia borealis TaxID=184061 RepID=A0AA39QVE3_9LECA|nr:hypothetical protein JMJ35_008517 [Cladonia borealis]